MVKRILLHYVKIGIHFSDNYNKPLNEHIIDELAEHMTKYQCSTVKFGLCFNQPVSNLPHGISTLIFGVDFNQRVDNLPSGLQQLSFGWSFNQPVDNLPKGLLNLTFGITLNQLVDNLPRGLQILKLLFYCVVMLNI